MTKFTKLSDLLGQEEKPKGKPIKFISFYGYDTVIEKGLSLPKDWDNVIHLGKDDYSDFFMCYCDKYPEDKAIYRGHLNDGFIEQ